MSALNQQKSQYHHFIPRLILRGFVEEGEDAEPRKSQATTNSKKKRNKYKKQSARDGGLSFIQVQDGTLHDGMLSRCGGLVDMYREVQAADQFELERKLGVLETRAGDVLARARKTFVQPGSRLVLKRAEKDNLRKFLFLMKYRSVSTWDRFNVDTIDDYKENDREVLREYMRERSFTSPREVWFANLHAFLDLEMDPERTWSEKIFEVAYEHDAIMFWLHVEQSYIAFCSPQNADDEFLLTENAFGIFEGPQFISPPILSGVVERRQYAEWHNFAPISSSLLIVLRSTVLPGDILYEGQDRTDIYQSILASFPSPEQAESILQDLPVRRCTTSYTTEANGQLEATDNCAGPSPHDQYSFQCFQLHSNHIKTINTLFLEEATSARTIVYRRRSVVARAIRDYLEDPRPGLKTLTGIGSPRERYLRALENALRSLEPSGLRVQTISHKPLPSLFTFPLDYRTHHAHWTLLHLIGQMSPENNTDFMRCYRALGGSTDKDRHGVRRHWIEDMQQGGLIAFFHIKTDRALRDLHLDTETRIRCKAMRQAFFATLRPRSIWMYVKVMRNLAKLSPRDLKFLIAPLQCEGREDEVVRSKSSRFNLLGIPEVCLL
jgi:hypothetical protein